MELTLDKLFVFPDNPEGLLGKSFVGIDFGTSTTVVSVASLNQLTKKIEVRCMQLAQKKPDGSIFKGDLLPTVIATDGKLYVGEGAAELKHRPEYEKGVNLWYAFKMELGTDMGPKYYRSENKLIKSPQDATKLFFKYLKREIEKYVKENSLGEDIRYAVSIPASFESNQRKDLLDALHANEMDILGENLIDEPNAAFIGYINPDYTVKDPIVLDEEYNPKVLVFDFGAGTCDLSLLEIGVNSSGYYSKNISISQFEELGGNDIDRYIAHNYLYPQLLETNQKDKDDYTTSQETLIVEQLYGIAERLKVKISRELDLVGADTKSIQMMLDHDIDNIVEEDVCIYTDYGDLKMSEFHLSYKDFEKTMSAFMNKRTKDATKVKRQKKYNSIYAAIDSALTKAHLDRTEIDYVVLIGGSSKNPYVQGVINDYFAGDTQMLIPQDLQSLVSQGAAIHSLLLHGLGTRIIKPITSEPIVIVTSGREEHVAIPAGTEIPFEAIRIKGLFTSKEQSVVEIPICVTNAKKMLANVKISAPNGSNFPIGTELPLTLKMNVSKALVVKCEYAGKECEVIIENPFANTYLTGAESKILEAERKCYIDASKNGGKPSKQSLINLREAYNNADKTFEAAETLEQQLLLYPDDGMQNRLGVLYHNSGNYGKAIRAFRKAIEYDYSNNYAHSNLGHDLLLTGRLDEATKELKIAVEQREDNGIALYKLARALDLRNEKKEAGECRQRAYNIMFLQFSEGRLDEVEKGWFMSIARELGHADVCSRVSASMQRSYNENDFNIENLATYRPS